VDELGSDLNQGRENMYLSLFRGKDSIKVKSNELLTTAK